MSFDYFKLCIYVMVLCVPHLISYSSSHPPASCGKAPDLCLWSSVKDLDQEEMHEQHQAWRVAEGP